MKIEIPFKIGETVWFIHPKSCKAAWSTLKKIKIEVEADSGEMHIKKKYNVDMPNVVNEEGTWVWNIYKSKEELINNL